MRRIAFALALGSLVPFGAPRLRAQAADSAPPALSASHVAAATELLRLLEMEKVIQASMEATFEAQFEAQPMMQPYKDVMLAWAEKIFTWEKVGPRFAKLYAEQFTEPELLELVAFYRTPIGRKLAGRTPELMRAGARLGESVAAENMSELESMIQARMLELQQRPPAPR